MIRKNLVKHKLLSGEAVIGTMIQEISTPAIAQILKVAGYDFFMIDIEHGSYSLETASEILRVGRILDLCPMVRVKSAEYHLISGPLDQGALGVMLPRIERREEVELLVQSMKYPPMGRRGCSSDAPHAEYCFGPLKEFIEENNRETLVIAQIERKAAVNNIDDLLSVPGVDVAFIGPEDLSVSMGVPGETGHTIVLDAIRIVIESAKRHNVVPGVHVYNVDEFKAWLDRGMRFFLFSSDLSFLMETSTAGIKKLRGILLQ